MFSFLPPLLIILAIVGIIVIVLRRIPELREQIHELHWKHWGRQIWQGLLWAGQKLWHFVLEVKGLRWHLPRRGSKASVGPETMTPEGFETIEQKYIKQIEEDPQNEKAFAELGRLYLAHKKFKEAVETYRFLTKHHPENDGYFSQLGQGYHNLKKYQLAIEAYEQAIELAPDNPKRYANLGLTLEAMNHLEEAILNYRKAVELEGHSTHYLTLLAEALIKHQETKEAEKFLEKVLQLEPTNHQAREKLMQLKY